MNAKIRMHKQALATFCVSICAGDGGGGTGAKASAHDSQIFACEAGLLLQLTLQGEREIHLKYSWG